MKKARIVIGIVAVLAVIAGTWIFVQREKIANEASRTYWNFNRYGIGPGFSVQMFVGCQAKTMMEIKTDEQFSSMWEEYSTNEHFDAIDVDRYMMKRCPPSTPEEVSGSHEKYYAWLNKQLREGGRPEINQEKQKRDREEATQKEIAVSEYQRKFLSREFTALRDEPKE